MSEALRLMVEASEAGAELWIDGGTLVVQGPRACDPILQRLLPHAAEVRRILIDGTAEPLEFFPGPREMTSEIPR